MSYNLYYKDNNKLLIINKPLNNSTNPTNPTFIGLSIVCFLTV